MHFGQPSLCWTVLDDIINLYVRIGRMRLLQRYMKEILAKKAASGDADSKETLPSTLEEDTKRYLAAAPDLAERKAMEEELLKRVVNPRDTQLCALLKQGNKALAMYTSGHKLSIVLTDLEARTRAALEAISHTLHQFMNFSALSSTEQSSSHLKAQGESWYLVLRELPCQLASFLAVNLYLHYWHQHTQRPAGQSEYTLWFTHQGVEKCVELAFEVVAPLYTMADIEPLHKQLQKQMFFDMIRDLRPPDDPNLLHVLLPSKAYEQLQSVAAKVVVS